MRITSLLVAVNVAEANDNAMGSRALAEVVTQALRGLSGRNQLVEAAVVAVPEEPSVDATGHGVEIAEPAEEQPAFPAVMPVDPLRKEGADVIPFPPIPFGRYGQNSMGDPHRPTSSFQEGLLPERGKEKVFYRGLHRELRDEAA